MRDYCHCCRGYAVFDNSDEKNPPFLRNVKHCTNETKTKLLEVTVFVVLSALENPKISNVAFI